MRGWAWFSKNEAPCYPVKAGHGIWAKVNKKNGLRDLLRMRYFSSMVEGGKV
jgi:hypothetical protein